MHNLKCPCTPLLVMATQRSKGQCTCKHTVGLTPKQSSENEVLGCISLLFITELCMLFSWNPCHLKCVCYAELVTAYLELRSALYLEYINKLLGHQTHNNKSLACILKQQPRDT